MTTHDNPEVLDNDENSPSGLRATIERLQEKIKTQDTELTEQRVERRDRALEGAKLDGVARKAIEKDMTRGDYDGELTPEAIQEYATSEYGWKPSEGGAPDPAPVDDATKKRMDAQQSRDDLNASSHARGDQEESPEANQAQVDKQLGEGDLQGAILTELTSKVDRAT